MNRLSILAVTTVSLLTLGATPPAGKAFGQEKAELWAKVGDGVKG